MKRDLINLESVIAAAVEALDGLSAADALTRARAILAKAAELGHGGADYYLPTFRHLAREDIAAKIRAEFNGRNLKSIIERYGKSKTTIYRMMNDKKAGTRND